MSAKHKNTQPDRDAESPMVRHGLYLSQADRDWLTQYARDRLGTTNISQAMRLLIRDARQRKT